MKKIFSLGLVLIISHLGMATVETQNGNYVQSWVDFERELPGFNLRLYRTYNSRTFYSGLFGRGWCSDFETRLEATAEGYLLLTECGAGKISIFSPSALSSKSTEIQEVLTFILQKEKGTEKEKSQFKEILEGDVILRSAYALKWKFPFVSIKEGQKYFSSKNIYYFQQRSLQTVS